jgi:hypothetical protein
VLKVIKGCRDRKASTVHRVNRAHRDLKVYRVLPDGRESADIADRRVFADIRARRAHKAIKARVLQERMALPDRKVSKGLQVGRALPVPME